MTDPRDFHGLGAGPRHGPPAMTGERDTDAQDRELVEVFGITDGTTPAPSVPGDDPVVTATRWLNLYQSCDLNCTENHPVAHSTFSGLHAVAATARIAASEYKRERDEARGRCRAVAVLLREIANRHVTPTPDTLRQLAGELEAWS